MRTISVSEAGRNLSALLAGLAATGDSVLLTRRGLLVAKILPWDETQEAKARPPLRGLPIEISPDFDAPLEIP